MNDKTGSILETLPEGTHTVAMGGGDLNGIMRGKRIPASNWPDVCRNGNALSMALLALDMTSDVWDTPYVSFDNGYPDMHMFPLTQPVAAPWEPGLAICLGFFKGMDHKPVPIDPRNALTAQVARAESMGYSARVGAELEFYLLDPTTLKPKDRGIQVYSLTRAAELEHVIGPIRRQLNEAGIPIEQSNPEYAAGQVEINMRYEEALLVADRVVIFREIVHDIARIHGYRATFMSKPFAGESGSGFHTHHSLWKNGTNCFSDGNGELSDLGKSYLAGLQKRMAESAIASATTPNAYRRRQPYSFCPINTAWGRDNRTAALRVIEGSNNAVRIEKRDGSADCNPYYLLATEIAAGLDGIEQDQQPSPMCDGNAYESENAEPIPRDISTAIQLASKSDWIRDVLGSDRLTILLQQAEREADFIAAQVTPVEIERYLENF